MITLEELLEDAMTSEFSMHEILYMGNPILTIFVEAQLGDVVNSCDPFDICARQEEEDGAPLAFKIGRIPM